MKDTESPYLVGAGWIAKEVTTEGVTGSGFNYFLYTDPKYPEKHAVPGGAAHEIQVARDKIEHGKDDICASDLGELLSLAREILIHNPSTTAQDAFERARSFLEMAAGVVRHAPEAPEPGAEE